MNPSYYKVRGKKGGDKKDLTGILLILSSLVLAAFIFTPFLTGNFGQWVHTKFKQFAGWGSFLIPIYVGWLGFQQFSKEKRLKQWRDSALSLTIFLFFCSLVAMFSNSEITKSGGWGEGVGGVGGMGGVGGGWLGEKFSLFLVQQFGLFFVFPLLLLVLFITTTLLIGKSPRSILASLKQKIALDIADWKTKREKFSEQNSLRKKLDLSSNKPPLSPIDQGKIKFPSLSKITPDKTDLGALTSDRTLIEPAEILKPLGTENQESKNIVGKISATESSNKVPLPSNASSQEKGYAGYLLPKPDLLTTLVQSSHAVSQEELFENGTLLEQTLEQFHVKAKVIDIHPGPVITRYDLSPAPGMRVQAIETLSNDIALAMKAQSLRVLAPVPGKAAVGIEISNPHPAIVSLKEIILSPNFKNREGNIPFALGKTTEGDSLITDLVSMPHLLIAGATGSGKSVCIHTVILSILFCFRPDEIKLLLIDPKRLELSVYDGIPHLYDPACDPENVKVITNPKEVVQSLKKLVDVMEERYTNFAKVGVRNIESYNKKSKAYHLMPEPYIVVVIDELADLMIVTGREVEDLIQRLAQMARAVGIHLILATQRPSVDVITGVIKANLPSRIAFQVLSKTDSRVILDSQGAEDLLGRGDMLFLSTGAPKPIRLQGAFVSESDLHRVIQFIKGQNLKPQYQSLQTTSSEDSIVDNEENRKLLLRAARVIQATEKVSGDLLRADKEIGSKYDLALTLLKKKGLIEKPRETNRWKIYFDRLDELLLNTEKKV